MVFSGRCPPVPINPQRGFSVFLRIVVITGTSSGLGKAATKALLRAGWEQPVRIEWDKWDSDLMGFNGDLMGFNGDLMWFNGNTLW